MFGTDNLNNATFLDKKKSKAFIRSLIVAVGIYFIIVAGNNILRPYYLNYLDQEVELSFFATAEKNQHALANNIRISYVSVNGKNIDLSQVELPVSGQWKYSSEDDILYIYNAEKPEKLTIKLSGVHSLSIGTVREVGSGIVDIYINNKLITTEDLYADIQWKTTEIRWETSFLVFPEKNLILQFMIFCLIWFGCWKWIEKKTYCDSKTIWINRSACIGFLAIVITGCAGLIQYKEPNEFMSHVLMQPQSFLKAMVFLFLVMYVISIFTDKVWLAFSVVAAVIMIGGLISREKLENQDAPLLPWDILKFSAAINVAHNYEIMVYALDIAALVVVMLITILLVRTKQKSYSKMKIRCGIGFLLTVITLLFVRSSFINCEIESNHTEFRVYRINDYYYERGFISAFLEYISYYNGKNEPENYSKETMEKIVDTFSDQTAEGNQSPTIIAVMSESFWDIERMDTIDFQQPVLPNFHALQKECRYGELYSHVLNGGTVVSEFEFLTGFSGKFFPKDYMVYGNFLQEGFSSVVNILGSQGYHTMAIHPSAASNYNRRSAYQRLGFDKSIFDEDFESPKSVRNYISDEALFDKAIEEYQKNQADGSPQFIFLVTMQNHGGYWGNTIYQDSCVPFETQIYGEVAQECIDDYVAGLHESDRALKKLVQYFRNVNEDIIIIYFGDHVSNAGPKDDRILEKTEWSGDPLRYDYETHKVPFLVWSNFDATSQDMGTMEISELLPFVFKQYNIKSNKFWGYIQDTKDVYAASDNMIVVNYAGEFTEFENMTEKQRNAYDTYELLQYDYIWGKQFAAQLWDID